MGKGVGNEAASFGKAGVDKVYLLEDDGLENFVDDVQSKLLGNLIEKEKPNQE